MEVRESVAQATGTAGSAVVFAGMTVVIALVGLCRRQHPVPHRSWASPPPAPSTIAVLIAITLLPALLGFCGPRLARANRLFAARRKNERAPISAPLGRLRHASPAGRAAHRPGRSWPWLAIPATHMKLGLPDGSSEPTTSTERRSYDLLTEGFGPGFNGTLTVVVDAPEIARERAGAVRQAGLRHAAGLPGRGRGLARDAQRGRRPLDRPGHARRAGRPRTQTRDLVTALRDKADELPKDAGITAYVTGQTAVNIDTADRLSEALPTLHRRRRRARAAAADGRVPLDPRAAEGGRRLPALDRRLDGRRPSGSSRTATSTASSTSPPPARSSRSCRSC